MVAFSVVCPEDWSANHDLRKYWKDGASRYKRPESTTEATRVEDCMTQRFFLSDIVGHCLTEAQVLAILYVFCNDPPHPPPPLLLLLRDHCYTMHDSAIYSPSESPSVSPPRSASLSPSRLMARTLSAISASSSTVRSAPALIGVSCSTRSTGVSGCAVASERAASLAKQAMAHGRINRQRAAAVTRVASAFALHVTATQTTRRIQGKLEQQGRIEDHVRKMYERHGTLIMPSIPLSAEFKKWALDVAQSKS
jgi:hypothetical protein